MGAKQVLVYVAGFFGGFVIAAILDEYETRLMGKILVGYTEQYLKDNS